MQSLGRHQQQHKAFTLAANVDGAVGHVVIKLTVVIVEGPCSDLLLNSAPAEEL
jgi:hypothetical protein